jgi:hypothetical protein
MKENRLVIHQAVFVYNPAWKEVFVFAFYRRELKSSYLTNASNFCIIQITLHYKDKAIAKRREKGEGRR